MRKYNTSTNIKNTRPTKNFLASKWPLCASLSTQLIQPIVITVVMWLKKRNFVKKHD